MEEEIRGSRVVHGQELQCIWKIFRPLDFFHILLGYSIILKYNTLFFPSSIYTQYPIMTKQKQVFRNVCKFISHLHNNSDPLLSTLWKHLWQRLQPWVFLGWRYKLGKPVFGEGSFSHSSLQIKLCQVGWGVSLHSYFQVSPEMFDRVQVRALAGPLNDIQRLIPKPLLLCLGCVLRVVVLLEGEPSPQSEVLSTVGFHQGSLSTLLRSSSFNPD